MSKIPDKDSVHPNSKDEGIVFLKNIMLNDQIDVGDYTVFTGEDFSACVLDHNPELGDQLIIGKFCVLGKDLNIYMNGMNSKMDGVTTYPFYKVADEWREYEPQTSEMPFKGDTVIGNDVWIGDGVTIMPGVFIGDGAIVRPHSVVVQDIPAYHVAEGNPAKLVATRFSTEFRMYLLKLKWWNWDIEKINENIPVLMSGDLSLIKKIDE